ncbi:HNH endonuclease [Azospirillum sp. SYSU D00513]|uniref:HNH endonuclease n=1 Tax=Azospirillum sp. SYSU D00513 TaxID=2812561 RepID=UPI001A95F53C|nr:HNH endonuclease [Azospirillum sp. SYSU D00513]
MSDPDASFRLAAFDRLRLLAPLHGSALPWSAIEAGFTCGKDSVRFASAAQGIFKPAQMKGVLSVKTVVPKPGGRVWYHDQLESDTKLRAATDTLTYAFKGTNPDDTQNRLLRDAMERQLPLIYFYGVAPAFYEPIFPSYVVDWDPKSLSVKLAPKPATDAATLWMPPNQDERRYALRQVKQRLHQSSFRERVVAAYGGRCALTGLPELRLVDAAHIVPDIDPELGQPDIRNGICMSKLHHVAYDADLIGIDPDHRIHVSERLLDLHDGPLLEHGIKGLAGKIIRLPSDDHLKPDRERLALRFERFKKAA